MRVCVLCPCLFSLLSISHTIGVCDVSCNSQRYWYKLYWKDDFTPIGNPRGFAVDLTHPKDFVSDFIDAVFNRTRQKLEGLDESDLEVIDDFAHIFPFHFAHFGSIFVFL
jgi:hypothetical protein